MNDEEPANADKTTQPIYNLTTIDPPRLNIVYNIKYMFQIVAQ